MVASAIRLVVLLALGVAAGLAAMLLVDRYQQDEALSAAFNRLRLYHDLRRNALDDYIQSMASDVRAASENPSVVAAMEKMDIAWGTYGPEASEVIRRLYIDESPVPPDERYRVHDAGDGSFYSSYHRDFHEWARRFIEHFGYYDLFLISPRGWIVYTVAKEQDFGTSLKSGPYRHSPLAEVFRRAMATPSATIDFSDFASYAPSGDVPAAFAAQSVVKDGNVIGVFAVQIPAEPLNELMHFTAGMGDSGETYLVGPDKKMRSQSRFIKTPTLLEVEVDSAAVREGIAGKSGAQIANDYRGIPVLSVYAPVDFGGQSWALLAEIDRQEVLGDRKPFVPVIAGVLAGLLAMGFAWLIWRLLRRPPQPATA